ncbi:Vms1/Ankzf1 family peptidyl-tRNA hydrolase [Ilumatobacter sp.]|uniref:baeRF2 domain-containing protein n=1 Tax=Ilumatobacter sp. TaxID=1967498 RepID=UPI003B522660
MSTDTADLRDLLDGEGPYLTIALPAPSAHPDAAHRFDIERKNVVRAIPGDWPDDDRDELVADLDDLPHDAGAAVIAVRRLGGPTHVEFIADEVHGASVFQGPLPRLVPLLDARQRTIGHVVVECDLAGADIVSFDGGTVLETETVEGDTEHIHRGHPGGWSQRRFQQRAENTWEENAADVVEATMETVDRSGARLVAVTGPTRARSMVVEGLREVVEGRGQHADVVVVGIESGDAEGIAADVVRHTADIAARDSMAAIDDVKERASSPGGYSPGEISSALAEGRVELLLVDDADPTEVLDDPAETRFVDHCVAGALRSGADIRVVPNVAVVNDGVGAIMRW